MSFFMMQKFHKLILFIWLVSVLTLSISDEIKTDGDTTLTLTLNANFTDGDSKTEHRTLSSPIQFTSESVNSAKTQNKNVATPLVAGEGGPISIISTTEPTFSTNSHKYLTNATDSLDVRVNVSTEDDNVPYVKSKKTTSKIVSRKGANSSIETISSNDTKTIIKSLTTTNVHNIGKIDTNMNELKSNITDKHTNTVSNTIVNSTLQVTNVIQQKLPSAAVINNASSVREHKHKPTRTQADSYSDKQAFIDHANSYYSGSRLGMPKKIDYVLPVIVTLIALPVLGGIIFMIYKQGRDCWDKRHYRRMDFLIDGMYND
ncbi:uncharacterized protein [Bombus flavifrons]|uniref:uncharacterized protein n=1 Tax=Bombus flavifrons TaxID=103934 RepID=UPI003704D131